MANLKALLHHETLLEAYQEAAAEVGKPLFDKFYRNPRPARTDDASLLVTPAQNKAAPFNTRGAPARVLSLQGKSKRQGAMFHTFNELQMSTQVFQGLREPSSEVINEIASGEIRDQLDQFVRRHEIQKNLAMAKFLVTGEVIVDTNGEIVESNSGDDVTLDFEIASTHQGQLNGLIDVTWASSAADPEKQFENIKEQARAENAPPPDLVIANSKIKQRIRAMTKFATLAAASPMTSEKLLQGEFVEGLFGMKWWFVDGTYEDPSGTTRKYIPDDMVIMVPENNTNWLRNLSGLELVPTDINVGPSLEEKVNSLAKVYGDYAYAKLQDNPVRLSTFYGSHYGWVVAEPNAIWQADVVFG